MVQITEDQAKEMLYRISVLSDKELRNALEAWYSNNYIKKSNLEIARERVKHSLSSKCSSHYAKVQVMESACEYYELAIKELEEKNEING